MPDLEVRVERQVVGVVEVTPQSKPVAEILTTRIDVLRVAEQGPPGPPGPPGDDAEINPNFVIDGGNF